MEKSLTFGRHGVRRADKPQNSVKVDALYGLSSSDAAVSAEKFGKNAFTVKKRRTFASGLLSNLNDPIIRVLIGALLVNIIFTFKNVNWIEAGGIALTVMISALVSTISEYGSGRAYDRIFSDMTERKYTVVRDGKTIEIGISDIVKFDLVCLKAGEIIPADGLVVSGGISADQSALTGEAKAIEKLPCGFRGAGFTEDAVSSRTSPSDNSFLCRGASVISGECEMIVTAVGDSTMYGAIASELQEGEQPSPLKERLTSLARTVSRIGYAGAAIAAAAYLISSLILGGCGSVAGLSSRISDVKFVASELLHALTLAVSIVVVAVPEGLPMMITVVLSANMKKMMKHGVLVRRLVGIETSGSLSILFTDKTGTVTSGKMRVESVITSDRIFKKKTELREEPELYEILTLGQKFCSGGGGGNMTDRAVGGWLSGSKKGFELIEKLPFDSSNKYAAALIRNTATGRCVTIVRGAPELILPHCSKMIGKYGETPFRLSNDVTSVGSARLIAAATGSENTFYELKKGKVPDGLTFSCIFRIRDEIRGGVREAVESCKNAGVHVVMITGDSETTAAAVAEEAGILRSTSRGALKNERVLTSEKLRGMTDQELTSYLDSIDVIARVTPADKSRLVRVAMAAGHVVGMTGDGVNDAPALKAADVGFAMGSGTEVAREAGDIIITDDNFTSIGRAILYGRTIFESIRKFILFQLTMNICAVGISILGPLLGVEVPITITQMLWINVIMDTLGSLAFAGESPLASYMKRPPRRRDEPILSRGIAARIICGGAYTLALSVFFLTSSAVRNMFRGNGEIYYLTLFFSLFVFCGIANSFCARTERINLLAGLGRNRAFIMIMALVCSVQLIMVYFGGEVFRTVPLDRHELIISGLIAMTVFPADLIFKLFLKKRTKS